MKPRVCIVGLEKEIVISHIQGFKLIFSIFLTFLPCVSYLWGYPRIFVYTWEQLGVFFHSALCFLPDGPDFLYLKEGLRL